VTDAALTENNCLLLMAYFRSLTWPNRW